MEGSLRVLREILIDHIRPARFQARQIFPDEAIAQLAASMKEVGQNTPPLLRPIATPPGAADSGEWFELVCGECRMRAAKQLGWTKLWAIVEEMSDENAALRGMVDNEQRQSLSPIERALGYRRLMTEYNLTQEQVAERSGIAPPTISRLLGLLDEPAEIQEMLKKKELTEAHCRPLDRLQDRKKRLRLAKEVVARGMSANETGRRVQKLLARRKEKTPAKKNPADLATDYGGFRFWWEGEEVAIRARNFRPGDLVDQYAKDFRIALLGFLRNEPRAGATPPEVALLANAANADVEPPVGPPNPGVDATNNRPSELPSDFGAHAEELAKSFGPLGELIHGLAKTFGSGDPSKK